MSEPIRTADEIPAAAERCLQFEQAWGNYSTPGEGIGNPVSVPWNLWVDYTTVVHAYVALAARPAALPLLDPKYHDRAKLVDEARRIVAKNTTGGNCVVTLTEAQVAALLDTIDHPNPAAADAEVRQRLSRAAALENSLRECVAELERVRDDAFPWRNSEPLPPDDNIIARARALLPPKVPT